MLARWRYTRDEWRDFAGCEGESNRIEFGDLLTKYFHAVVAGGVVVGVVGAAEDGVGVQEAEYAGIVVPLRLVTESGVLLFISTTTVFGRPADVTLPELALESFFPGRRRHGSGLEAFGRAAIIGACARTCDPCLIGAAATAAIDSRDGLVPDFLRQPVRAL